MSPDKTKIRRMLLMAYGLAEMESIQLALWHLGNEGDAIARLTAMSMQPWIDDAAAEWALQNGLYKGFELDHTTDSVKHARAYLTAHVRALDNLLAEIKEEHDR